MADSTPASISPLHDMFSFINLFKRKPSRAALVNDVMRELQKAHPGKDFTHNGALHQITGPDIFINLANVYHDYCRAPQAARSELVAKFVRGFTAQLPPDAFSDARPQILPVLRHMSGFECSQISMGGAAPDSDLYRAFAIRPFSQALGVGIAFDTPESVQQVGAKTLAKWNLDFDEVLAVALDNLRHKSAPKFAQFAPGLFVSQFNDFYDATRILLPELAWQLPLKGNPVAMIPSRISLLICGDQDEAAIAAMLSTAQKVVESESRLLGTEMFRLVDQTWVSWQPPGQLGERVKEMQMHTLATDYLTQQEALRADLERRGQDIFVASFALKQKGREQLNSFCVLTKGVASWLPQADSVVVLDLETKEKIEVPWTAFTDITKGSLEKLPYLLPRYRVFAHPDENQLARLRQVALAA